ncbi:putative pumilio homolog 8, chloroplastic isoform X2 [Phalaenopsis equestris]|uniref:putative pumilio homolog 8, chloroplastic isoform X2 n=1 Tax=Phalaenopsis equestris TaxID=78828 RepID=UPI0009E4C9CB|nr:putative pumilio homolog 8, chloroplastic isoform X2 [Phalaenopsis equestris]
MDRFCSEIPNAISGNASIGGITVSRDERRGYDLHSSRGFRHSCYNASGIDECSNIYVPKIGRFSEASSSSSSRLNSHTPSFTEEDPRLWMPDFGSNNFASVMRMEEHGLLEKLQFLRLRDNLSKGCFTPAKAVTTNPSFHHSSVLTDFSPLDDRMRLLKIYSSGWIGDRPGFSYPPQFKTRSPDVAADTPLTEYYLRCKGNDVHLNPTFGILNSEDSVNGYRSKLQYEFPVINGRFARSIEAFGCEDSFIMQEKGLYSSKCNRNALGDWRRTGINIAHTEMVQKFQRLSPSASLLHKKESIYHMAKDQDGCRFLQKKLEERNAETIDFIFYGVIDHVLELTENPFGNYLMQKLLEICSMEQRMKIIRKLTSQPSELIRISLNTHGTRTVQKLIDTLKTREEILLVTCALRPGFLQLIKDPNGNHVVQKCLLSLKAEDNKFIFDAATKHCIDIATHRHGCCVLQCCISRSNGEQLTKLLFEISSNGLLLARDAFGNYVVQYILDLNNPSTNAILLSQFKGNYVELSMQKFSSNVVEKCLKVLGEDERAKIIAELLHKETFEQLLQDPYANYVIQSALFTTKGSPLHASLVHAIRHSAAKLKTNPYCRRIFSRTLRNDL